MVLCAFRYAYQIKKKEISPILSTWIIFLLGTLLSLITYALAEKHDFRSGILNTLDVLVVMTVFCSILAWGNRQVRFKPFERWYLLGIALITLYGLVSGDAWSSNIFTQLLISIGYAPTIQNLITQKKNTESFTG